MNYNYFNFKPFHGQYLLTTDAGNFVFVGTSEFKALVSKQTDLNTETGRKLMDAGIVYQEHPLEFAAKQQDKLRRNKSFLANATALHIFVVTTACNLQCVYCQANSGEGNAPLFMTEEIACRAAAIALQSPEKQLSFEFQGGEPLLNFKVIRAIVEYAEENKGGHCVTYSIVSNLTMLTDEIIEFLKEHDISVSTSLDGYEELHNCNRHFPDGSGSYDKVKDGVHRLKEAGISVGAIQTTTKASLSHPQEIIKAYVDMGFESVFIRPLTPLGRAGKDWSSIGYSAEEYLHFYGQALHTAIDLNREGAFFREAHASIFLQRIFGQGINYMELRSPCGAGTGQMAYYADGNIFTCDEARMLHEMGDSAFRLGDVWNNNYQSLIRNGICKTACAASILESVPSCTDCVYQPYCGTCPVVQYAMTCAVMEKSPRGYRCKIYSGMLDLLFERLLENNEEVIRILESWCN